MFKIITTQVLTREYIVPEETFAIPPHEADFTDMGEEKFESIEELPVNQPEKTILGFPVKTDPTLPTPTIVIGNKKFLDVRFEIIEAERPD